MWSALDIVVKKLDSKNNWTNVPTARNKAIDEALENEGIGKALDSNGLEIDNQSMFNFNKDNNNVP
jgi:hypothetical protein